MTQTTISSLQRGDFFTRKAIEDPTESQVWVRGSYYKSRKAFACYKFGDVMQEMFFKGDKAVFTGFTF